MLKGSRITIGYLDGTSEAIDSLDSPNTLDVVVKSAIGGEEYPSPYLRLEHASGSISWIATENIGTLDIESVALVNPDAKRKKPKKKASKRDRTRNSKHVGSTPVSDVQPKRTED